MSFALAQQALKSRKTNETLRIAKSVELVIEKSTKPNVRGMIFIIVNCSNGENDINKVLLKTELNRQ